MYELQPELRRRSEITSVPIANNPVSLLNNTIYSVFGKDNLNCGSALDVSIDVLINGFAFSDKLLILAHIGTLLLTINDLVVYY